jgi:sugar transferase (PEP-CTERM/EpsH1 system associated)
MALACLTGAPMSVARFRQGALGHWIDNVLSNVKPDIVYVYSSALGQYVAGRVAPHTGLIVDFVDADAEKWRAYGLTGPLPVRWIYAREFRSLVRYEAGLLDAADAGILVSETERRLQAGFASRGAAKLHVISNGVDAQYFQPSETVPVPAANPNIVFTGTMDYLPNIDAVQWFATEMLPDIRKQYPQAVFQIVGAKPAAQVMALRDIPGVEVTGAVPDVRPYIAGAAVIVAPLRIARGIQNKVLEGMAAGKPVVATPDALDGINAEIGRDVLVGTGRDDFVRAVVEVLSGRASPDMGQRARAYVLGRHQWREKLVALDDLVAAILHARSAQASA